MARFNQLRGNNMNVTYYINSGRPCSIATGLGGVTIKEAIEDFKEYLNDCDRYGNDATNASLEITGDLIHERLYTVGPRGGVKREI